MVTSCQLTCIIVEESVFCTKHSSRPHDGGFGEHLSHHSLPKSLRGRGEEGERKRKTSRGDRRRDRGKGE